MTSPRAQMPKLGVISQSGYCETGNHYDYSHLAKGSHNTQVITSCPTVFKLPPMSYLLHLPNSAMGHVLGLFPFGK